MKIEIKNRSHLFWVLQTLGWVIYALIFYLISKKQHSDFTSNYLFFITYVVGLGITVGLRYIYKYIYKNLKSALKLMFYILVLSLTAVIIWDPIDVFLSAPFWEDGVFSNWLTIYSDFKIFIFIKINLNHFIIFVLWSTLYFAIKFWLDWQSQKEKVEKANSLAQEAQLQMLRYQLNPHFLFNSLNSIRALVDEDGKSAKEMITELSEFLRYSLINDNNSFKPLKNELEAIKHYFSIEKKRFEEKLEITYNIDKKAENYKVLSFLIQPFVENAIKYGMQTSPMPLKINISANINVNKLIINIKNSGRWIDDQRETFASKQWKGTGKGLENVKMRLENAYPGKHKLEIEKNEEYVRVILEIIDNNYASQ